MTQDSDFRLRFGKRVRLLRVMREISQDKLGIDCGLDQSYISAIGPGKRNITWEVFGSLLKRWESR